jgi:hypothetical protein
MNHRPLTSTIVSEQYLIISPTVFSCHSRAFLISESQHFHGQTPAPFLEDALNDSRPPENPNVEMQTTTSTTKTNIFANLDNYQMLLLWL